MGTEILSNCGASNAKTVDEEAISIADDYEPVFDGDIFQRSGIENPNISEFESVPGLIPKKISCGSITFNKHNIETVITPKSWVIVNLISAFMMILNEVNVLAVDSIFVEMFRRAIQLKLIPNYKYLLQYFFLRDIDTVLCKLKACQSVLIPIFNSTMKKTVSGKKKNSGDRLGSSCSSLTFCFLRLYHSIHGANKFEYVIPHILLLANSIPSRYNLTEAEWPIQWTYCSQVYSFQQGNGCDCGISAMLNPFYVSREIMRPKLIPGTHVSNVYRPHLGLCLLQSNTYFLL